MHAAQTNRTGAVSVEPKPPQSGFSQNNHPSVGADHVSVIVHYIRELKHSSLDKA